MPKEKLSTESISYQLLKNQEAMMEALIIICGCLYAFRPLAENRTISTTFEQIRESILKVHGETNQLLKERHGIS